jgi:hypothetical protein
MEIKFRGQKQNTNEWVVGYLAYLFNNKNSACIMPNCYFGTRDFGEEDDKGNPIIKDEMALGGFISVNYKTVSIFTGSIDFENKDIFVGDILSDRWKVEVYQNDEGTFMVKFHTNPKGNKSITLKQYLLKREKAGTATCDGNRDCVVIGNIYENPELIKTS